MNKIKINIWGRDFELEVKYDCYNDEKILPIQKDALKVFLSNTNSIISVKEDVEKYCLANSFGKIETDAIDNIFKYVIPKYLYIKRSKEKRVIAIMCNYKFDMEHGIALVFENEKLCEIGNQDIIL